MRVIGTGGVPQNPGTINEYVTASDEYYNSETLVSASGQIPVAVTEQGNLQVSSPGYVVEGSSTSTPLAASGVFVGVVENIIDYSLLFVNTYSDVSSATDGLCVHFSPDGVNWDGSDEYTIQAGSGKTFSFQCPTKYARVTYTNGDLPQTEFRLQTIVKHGDGKPSSHRIQDPIINDDDAELVKAVITGQTPENGFVNFASTALGNFRVALEEFGDTPSIDAFARLRVSNPQTLFDSKQLHDKQPLFWDEELGGSATSVHSSTDADVDMAVTASASDYAIRQTKQRFNYQPGKAQMAFMTFRAPSAAGVKQRVGQFYGSGGTYMTPHNGIWFENDAGTAKFCIAKNGSTTEAVSQSSWNVDTLDGSGDSGNPSGLTLDLNAPQILTFDYEWLGVGRVRIGFVINGIIHYCHHFNHANDITYNAVYMSTPNNPLRYDIQSDGSAIGHLYHICSTIMSEGGQQIRGLSRTLNTNFTHIDASAADTRYAILGTRLKAAYIDVTVFFQGITIINQNADDFLWVVSFNPTVNGTFTYSDIDNSALQLAVGVTANTITAGNEGFEIASGYASSDSETAAAQLENALTLGSTIAGVRDTFVLSVTPLTAGADIQAAINLRELL